WLVRHRSGSRSVGCPPRQTVPADRSAPRAAARSRRRATATALQLRVARQHWRGGLPGGQSTTGHRPSVSLMANLIVVRDKAEAGVAALVFCDPQRLVALGLVPVIAPMPAHLMRATAGDLAEYLAGEHCALFLRNGQRDHRMFQKFAIGATRQKAATWLDHALAGQRNFVER